MHPGLVIGDDQQDIGAQGISGKLPDPAGSQEGEQDDYWKKTRVL
jgi:hypothetical protein